MTRTATTVLLVLLASALAAVANDARVALISPQAASIGGQPIPLSVLAALGAEDPVVVRPGEAVDWAAWIRLDRGGWGLAFVSLDVTQDAANPREVALAPAPGPAAGMEPFDRPLGFSNPGESLVESGFGGTLTTDDQGRAALVQIGGAQNTFGAPPRCVGPALDVCVGQQSLPETGIATGRRGQVVAVGRFVAPEVTGLYTFRVSAARILELDANPVAGAATPVRTIDADLSGAYFVLDVRGFTPGIGPPTARDGEAAPPRAVGFVSGAASGSAGQEGGPR